LDIAISRLPRLAGRKLGVNPISISIILKMEAVSLIKILNMLHAASFNGRTKFAVVTDGKALASCVFTCNYRQKVLVTAYVIAQKISSPRLGKNLPSN